MNEAAGATQIDPDRRPDHTTRKDDENMSQTEKTVTYEHDPGPQWTVDQLVEALRRYPGEMPVKVSFAIDGPHAKIVDDQPVVGLGRNKLRWSSDGPEVEEEVLSIYTDYEAGRYERYVREGDAEFEEMEARGE
jgi:uncharacterized protein DUF6225